ncbi:GH1 family beta-glucosidase [Termitidicoccus mucosus]|uniref:Beta-glucosidase n=1 Tax=Termitidicoccus mucosus TaxID=1184151 RepID=A0A178IGZ1_9BACT|nr:beta-galactosidase [Opitutaceae bacterium TSB47]
MFPENFIWGAATAAYQIEGAVAEDGRGPSVWDDLVRQPGRIWEGHTGETACDHYHRWREDVALMKEIGLRAYRFSIAWPRVLPEGAGAPNEKGLAFYDRLVDALLDAGIQPWVTLFHWDYPLALYRRGGWLSPDSPSWFADYTALVARRLGDRVAGWFTHNEPQCFIGVGLQEGRHAPGLKLGLSDVLVAAHHTLLAHGRAVQTLRAHVRKDAKIGWAPIGHVHVPATGSAADIAAAKRATFSIENDFMKNNTWWSDPVYLGRYPEDGLARFAPHLPKITDADLREIHQPLDLCGLNIYTAERLVRAGPDGRAVTVAEPPGFAMTHMRGTVHPEALYYGAKFFHERYRLPICITENGLSCADWVARDGGVHDPNRIDFLSRYLGEFARAGHEGVPLAGYFQWSLLDNFEWAQGYQHRFGLVHVDFATQKRTLKDSARWYRETIAANGANCA